jgi:hypothetical protein
MTTGTPDGEPRAVLAERSIQLPPAPRCRRGRAAACRARQLLPGSTGRPGSADADGEFSLTGAPDRRYERDLGLVGVGGAKSQVLAKRRESGEAGRGVEQAPEDPVV